MAIAGLFECYNPLAIYLCIHLSSPFLCGLSFARLVCSIGKLRASRIICSRCSSLVMYSKPHFLLLFLLHLVRPVGHALLLRLARFAAVVVFFRAAVLLV